MLDSADLKQALKVTIRYDNRYERGTITEYAAKVRDAFAAYSVDYRTDSPGRGVEVLQQYKEYCSRNPVQQHWG